jgi:hypothetical protein
MNTTPNFKEIACAAGYTAYLNVSGTNEYWHWKNEKGSEKSFFPFGSEAQAYENCCRSRGLIKT